jgi:cytochrome P450
MVFHRLQRSIALISATASTRFTRQTCQISSVQWATSSPNALLVHRGPASSTVLPAPSTMLTPSLCSLKLAKVRHAWSAYIVGAEVRYAVIAQRRTQGDKGKKDLLDRLLHGRDPKTGQGLSEENIAYQLLTFIIAGSSRILNYAFVYH